MVDYREAVAGCNRRASERFASLNLYVSSSVKRRREAFGILVIWRLDNTAIGMFRFAVILCRSLIQLSHVNVWHRNSGKFGARQTGMFA